MFSSNQTKLVLLALVSLVSSAANAASIKASHSGKCLDLAWGASTVGLQFEQYDCNGTIAQQLNLVPKGNGTFEIRTATGSGLCMDVSAASPNNATAIQQWSCNDTIAQRFTLKARNGGYEIRPAVNPNNCVDVNGISQSNGAQIIHYSCTGNGNQLFAVSEIPQTSPPPPVQAPAPLKTSSGVILPAGWKLLQMDKFGYGAGSTISNHSQLHDKYFEGQYYNRDANGLVRIPNVVINDEQQTYVHFEEAVAFSADHITIQARGHANSSITWAEMVSKLSLRSFCVEARYKTSSVDKSWAAFWLYGANYGADASEIDFEHPVTPYQGVHDVTMHNHSSEGNITINDGRFSTQWMNFNDASLDASAYANSYTACYDDASAQMTRFINGVKVYSAAWKWNESLGGTGKGPDAATILNLAVGGNWPGNTSNLTGYSADMDIFSVEYYAP